MHNQYIMHVYVDAVNISLTGVSIPLTGFAI